MDYQTEEYATAKGYRLDYIQTSSCYASYISQGTNNNNKIEILYDDLIKSLNEDKDFCYFYKIISEDDRIYEDFTELDNLKKIEVLLKSYFFLQDLKEQGINTIEKLKIEKEEIIKKNELIIKEKEDSIKQKMSNLKLENECIKNELTEIKKSNINYQNEIESLKKKIKDFKKVNDSKGKDQLIFQQLSNEILRLLEEIDALKSELESANKLKEKFEKLSQEYIKRNEELEKKLEELKQANNDLLEKNTKLAMMNKYEGRFSNFNNGIALDNLMMSESHQHKSEKKEVANEFEGYMKVNLNPLKLAAGNSLHKQNTRTNNWTPLNKDFLIRDINMITNNILHKKEQNDPNQISNLLEFGSSYSSTISENEMEHSFSRQYSLNNIEPVNEVSNEVNESQYSEYANHKHNEIGVDYESESCYNSFNFQSTSRLANYSKKPHVIVKSDEFNSVASSVNGDGGYIPPSGYIPPKAKKVIEYAKEDYNSEVSEAGSKFKYKNTSSNNRDYISNLSNTSYDYYDYESHNKDANNRKVNFNRAGNIDEYVMTEYDNNSNYFETLDPK